MSSQRKLRSVLLNSLFSRPIFLHIDLNNPVPEVASLNFFLKKMYSLNIFDENQRRKQILADADNLAKQLTKRKQFLKKYHNYYS